MTKSLEDSLWCAVLEASLPHRHFDPWHLNQTREHPVRGWIGRAVEQGIIASPKQAWATLEKWSVKRCYDYGVTLDLGWQGERDRGERIE